MPGWFALNTYLRYRRTALNKHGVHSPFVFQLLTKVFTPQPGETFSIHPAEKWRAACLADQRTIQVTDFGTGNSGPRKISDIASRAAKPPAEGQLLHRIVRHYQPLRMLELGTSLGITTLYEATATSFEKFITLEGCAETAALAQNTLEHYQLPAEVRTGEFSQTLPGALQTLGKVDYVYFDGNHRKQPTLDYFNACLPFAHNDTIFVFDDIHWSQEMEEAWNEIHQHPRVTLSLDLFHFGIVFFRSEQQEKEHFVLKF